MLLDGAGVALRVDDGEVWGAVGVLGDSADARGGGVGLAEGLVHYFVGDVGGDREEEFVVFAIAEGLSPVVVGVDAWVFGEAFGIEGDTHA